MNDLFGIAARSPGTAIDVVRCVSTDLIMYVENQSIAFHVPSEFRSGLALPPKLAVDEMRAYYVMGTLIELCSRNPAAAFVSLSQNVLRNNGGRPALNILRELIVRGEIEATGKGRKRTYRPSSRYARDRLRRVECDDEFLTQKLLAYCQEHAEKQKRLRKPVHDYWEHSLRATLSVDRRLADRLLIEHPEFNLFGLQRLNINRIDDGDFRFIVDVYGRVHTNLTNLKSELRRALRIDSEPLAGLDICNSQPAFLAWWMCQESPPLGGFRRAPNRCGAESCSSLVSPCCDCFVCAACGGLIYDLLAADLGLARSEVKIALFRDVFGFRGGYQSLLRDAFRRRWPDVLQFIDDINRSDHRTLLRELQRMESRFVIEAVGEKLRERQIPALSLHDGIYTSKSNFRRLKVVFEETASELGFPGQTKDVLE